MKAACLACNWESLTYVHKGWADKSADRHHQIYHRGRSNIIAIRTTK